MRLDDDKLEALRRWGRGLRGAAGEEQAAAGRAILILIEEIERLRLELLRAREQGSRPEVVEDASAEDTGGRLAPTLQERLQRALTRDSDPIRGRPGPADEAESGPIREEAGTSPEAWIESLRRQE
jgi:hypothetical protein